MPELIRTEVPTRPHAMSQPLSPWPQKLAKLLVQSPDQALARKAEQWLAKESGGRYPFIHVWLDDADPVNLGLRQNLGRRLCEIIESGATAQLEE